MLFSLPRTRFDFGAIASLPAELDLLSVGRPLVISDAGLVNLGLVDRLVRLFDHPPAIFAEVHENPIYADAIGAADYYKEMGCDAIVALGGGSVIDTAKFASVIIAFGGAPADYIGAHDRIRSAVTPLIAIPTTAGTGSECSPDAGIHRDTGTASVGITNHAVIPRTTILDPELTLTLPPRLTAATGMDALSHCIEGYFAVGYAPFADAVALDGIWRAVRFLPQAARDGHNRDARREMMACAFAGGIAIGKGLGPAHAFAITCSDQGLHHGMLSALGLLATLDLVCAQVPNRAAEIAAAMGVPLGRSVRDGVAALMAEIGLPMTLDEMGYVVGDITALGRAAAASHFNLTSPYHPTVAEYCAAFVRQ